MTGEIWPLAVSSQLLVLADSELELCQDRYHLANLSDLL